MVLVNQPWGPPLSGAGFDSSIPLFQTQKAGLRAPEGTPRLNSTADRRREGSHPARQPMAAQLFNLDRCTRVFELFLELRRFVLVDALLDRLRRAFHQVLGLLKAQPGNGT